MKSFIRQLLKNWSSHEVSRRSAALAFYTFLSLGPLLIIVVSLVGLVYGKAGAEARIVSQARGTVGPTAASALSTILQHASSQGAGIAGIVVGSILLVVSASGIFSELQSDLDVIWGAKRAPRQKVFALLIPRGLSLLALLGVGLILLTSLLASALVSVLARRLSGILPASGLVLQAADFLVFLAIVMLLAVFVFRVLPAASKGWRAIWLGALVSSFLFGIGKVGIGLYLGRSSTSSSYGAAGAFVVLLLWMYYSAQILFIGAEVTALCEERRYKHIKESLVAEGRPQDEAEEIAARTVNKERARAGEAKEASKTSTQDISSGRRGGLRSHSGPGGRTYKQLYAEAQRRGIKGRSKMTKAELEEKLKR